MAVAAAAVAVVEVVVVVVFYRSSDAGGGDVGSTPNFVQVNNNILETFKVVQLLVVILQSSFSFKSHDIYLTFRTT